MRQTTSLSETQQQLPAPASGKAFYGIKLKDCVHPVLGSGAFVVGFFTYGSSSPVKEAGVLIGDQILLVNGHGEVTADEVSNYLKKIRSPAINSVVVRRIEEGRIARRTIEFSSIELPDSCVSPGRRMAVCVTPVDEATCP